MSGHVLIVDDDAALRESIANLLTDEGYSIEHAGDGVSALAAVEGRQPDAILLDFLMPNMNGREFLATLRRHPRAANVPVLVMTAVSGIESRNRPPFGANDIVEKPFDVEELLNKVALAIYRSRNRAKH